MIIRVNFQVFKSNFHGMMHQIKLLQCSSFHMEVFSSNKDASFAGWIAEHYVVLSWCFVHIMSYVTEIIVVPNKITMIYFKILLKIMMYILYHIMSPFGNNTTTIDNYINFFLQSVHHFEDYINIFAPNAPFMWYSRGNFLSLLNLPNQIK